MRTQKLYALSLFLFTSFLTIAMYQNCSKPVNDIGNENSVNGCPETDAVCIAQNQPFIKIGYGPDIDHVSNDGAIDMGRPLVFTFKNIPGANSEELPACTITAESGNCIGSGEIIRPDSGSNSENTFFLNVGTMYDEYYGLRFTTQAGTANNYASKTFYVNPPHIQNDGSQPVNGAYIWYTDDIGGLDRLSTPSNEVGRAYYIQSGQPFYSHIYYSSNISGIEVCNMVYKRNGNNNLSIASGFPSKAPSVNQANESCWEDITTVSYASGGAQNEGAFYHYRVENANGYEANSSFDSVVAYIRDKGTGDVIPSATTWIALD